MSQDPGGSGTPMSERMQSLLSRAVEDQLNEQRQLAGLLGDVRGQLARIHQEVEALRGSGAGAGGASDADALAQVSAEVREAVRLLAERVEGVARLVQQRGTDLSELKAALADLQATMRSHTDALGGVSGGLAALPAFGDRIGGLQDNLVALHDRLAALDETAGVVTTLRQQVDTMAQELRELRSAFAGMGARLAEVPGRPELESVVTRVGARVDELGEQVSALRPALTVVQERIAALGEGGDAEPNAAVEALRAELARFADTVVTDVARVQERLIKLDETMTEVAESLAPDPGQDGDEEEPAQPGEDAVLGELSELRDSLLGPGGLADKVEALADDDLDTRVGAAVREAVAAAETRLTAHMDEAVLALAEGLLRRRGSRSAVSPFSLSSQPMVAPPPANAVADLADEDGDDLDELDDLEDLEDLEELDDAEAVDDEASEDGAATDELAEHDSADSEVAEEAPAAVAAPAEPAPAPGWQTPPEPQVMPEPQAGRKRRPWWRPGD